MDTVIEVNGLRRRYAGGYEAVRGVTFDVARGELFALLGTNGAGKTSALEVLEGLARADGGSVRVLGGDPWRNRAAVRPRIGVMLQEAGFPVDLTVAETARTWARCTTGARPVDEALELVGLLGRRTVRVKQLSGGERRRLDLALAVLGRPEVLFLDEPTTGLDPEGRRDTWELVRGLHADGTTIVLTTHYLEEAEELSDRLAIMHEGRLVTEGTPAEIVGGQPARISFDLPREHPVDGLPRVPGTWGLENGGGRAVLHTARLQEALTAVLGWANDRGIELARLEARSASLEEAFLAIAADRAADDTRS